MKSQTARWILSSLCLLGLSSTYWVQAQSAVTAQETTQTVEQPALEPTIQFNPPPLPDRGRPEGRRRGGASRGNCEISEKISLTAMIPTSVSSDLSVSETSVSETNAENSTVETVFSLTAQARPSFWYYVPYPLETTQLEFVLQDENDNIVYQGLWVPEQSMSQGSGGVIQVSLPETAPALQPDGLYHWFFLAYCDDVSPEFVDGWIVRSPMAEALSTAVSNATLRERAILYAQNGLWQETLTLLGEAYKDSPTDPTHAGDWEGLLESAGLRELAEEPLVDCCLLE